MGMSLSKLQEHREAKESDTAEQLNELASVSTVFRSVQFSRSVVSDSATP